MTAPTSRDSALSMGESEGKQDRCISAGCANKQMPSSVLCREHYEKLPAPLRGESEGKAEQWHTLLIDAEALLCDERAGPVANELAAKIIAALRTPPPAPCSAKAEGTAGLVERLESVREVLVERDCNHSACIVDEAIEAISALLTQPARENHALDRGSFCNKRLRRVTKWTDWGEPVESHEPCHECSAAPATDQQERRT